MPDEISGQADGVAGGQGDLSDLKEVIGTAAGEADNSPDVPAGTMEYANGVKPVSFSS